MLAERDIVLTILSVCQFVKCRYSAKTKEYIVTHFDIFVGVLFYFFLAPRRYKIPTGTSHRGR